MTLSFVPFLFLVHLGVGIVLTLLLVEKVAGVKFFRFNAGFAATLLFIALAMRPDEVALGSGVHGIGLAALICSTGSLLVYWATIGRVLAVVGRIERGCCGSGASYSRCQRRRVVGGDWGNGRQFSDVDGATRGHLDCDDPRALVSRVALHGSFLAAIHR